jgi:hypothetical protein
MVGVAEKMPDMTAIDREAAGGRETAAYVPDEKDGYARAPESGGCSGWGFVSSGEVTR